MSELSLETGQYRVLTELFRRQRTLAAYGMLLLILTPLMP